MARSGPELVIGIVSALGVSNRPILAALESALSTVDYDTQAVSTIELVYKLFKELEPEVPRYELYHARMTKGNEFRRLLGRNDAVALASIADIWTQRETVTGKPNQPRLRCAYVVRSLKTPEEVDILRRVYGPNFVLVAAYLGRDRRRRELAQYLREDPRAAAAESGMLEHEADRLIARDEKEQGDPYGQNLGATFPLADIFIDAADPGPEVARFIELLFGHPFQTPRRDELAMFLAFGAAMRSASPSRQVGAAIVTADGEVVALGPNEVARAFGGQYWAGEKPDHRDHTRPSDVSHSLISDILRDLLARLRKKAWLNDQKATLDIDDLLKQAESELVGPCADRGDDAPSLREKASLYGLIEFMRAVHAEMAAISSAARRGIGINGCTIFSTTFPCHECARHIVAAGLTKAVFIDPYPKSRVGEMFDDSIAVDEEDGKRIPFLPYVGVSPRMYLQLFRAPKRRNPDGTLVNWEAIRRTQSPRLARSDYGYIEVEAESMDVFNQLLKSRLPGATKSGGHNG